MRFLPLVLLALAVGAAAAAEPEEPASAEATEPDAAAKAEYVRLSQEIASLADKAHWEGVERSYRKAAATGVPLSFADQMAGGSAALALGDVASARVRFLGARALREDDPSVIESLWAIDTAFAPVRLTSTPGAVLTVAVTPFQPDQARAIAFAATKVAETGGFTGYLPAGDYTLADTPFSVVVREVDADPIVVTTSLEPVRKKKKRK